MTENIENEPYLAWDERSYTFWGEEDPKKCWWVKVPKWAVFTYREGTRVWLIESKYRDSCYIGPDHPHLTFWTQCHRHGMDCHPLFALRKKK